MNRDGSVVDRRRLLRARVVALLVLALPGLPATPAGAAVSSIPDSTIEANGTVNAFAQSADRLFFGGQFTRAGVSSGSGIDVAQSDGARNAAFAAPAGGAVSAVVPDGAGGWYIGGAFTSVGNVARNRLAHLLADGSVDPAFNPNVDGAVTALVRSGTTLYAGGSFSAVGAATRQRLAAIDTATGLATSFDAGLDASGSVSALALSGSALYAGGDMQKGALTNLIALDTATGTAVASFNAVLNGPALSLAVSGTTVYAGGLFTNVNATTRNRLAALDASDGSLLAPFNPNLAGVVRTLAVAGGKVYAGGAFTTVNGSVTRNRLAAFDATSGTVDASFNPNVGDVVNAIAVSGATVYVAGNFTQVKDSVTRNRLAAFAAGDGSVTSFDPNVDGATAAIAVAGSRAYAGGSFAFAGAATIRNRLAAMKPDGTLDATFDPNIDNGFVANVNVTSLLLSASKLYVGGFFGRFNGGAVDRFGAAAVDTTTGVVDPTFDPRILGQVNALALSGGKLYAGGAFQQVNDGAPTVLRNRLVALDPVTGAADPTFDPNVSDDVMALAVSGGKVYAGGVFTSVNGGVARNRLAAFDATSGVVDGGFNPNLSNAVRTLALSGAKLYAGGQFATVNGGVTRNRLAAFDATSGTVDAFDAGLPASGAVSAIALSGGTLYAGGQFSAVNGSVARNHLAAVDAATGAVDPAFNPNMGNPVSALLATGSQLHAGGQFTTVGDLSRLRLARFSEAAAVPPAVVTGAASAIGNTTATVSGTVNPNGAAATYTFEYGTSTSFGSNSGFASAGSGSAAVPVSANLTGLAPDTTYFYRLVAKDAGGANVFGTVQTFDTGPGGAPVVTSGTASAVTTTGATLAGTVNPHGKATAFVFEYGTSTSFGSISAIDSAGSGNGVRSVSLPVTGLAPDTTYFYRLVATNGSGTTFGAVRAFDTGPGGAPIVATGLASAITATTATLAGSVNPHGPATAFTFEYGTTTSFGSISAVDSVTAGNGVRSVSLPLTGLAPGTTYLYRLVATNSNGTTHGVVQSFTTSGESA